MKWTQLVKIEEERRSSVHREAPEIQPPSPEMTYATNTTKTTKTTKTTIDEYDKIGKNEEYDNSHDWIGETSVDSKSFSVSVEIIFNSYYSIFAD